MTNPPTSYTTSWDTTSPQPHFLRGGAAKRAWSSAKIPNRRQRQR